MDLRQMEYLLAVAEERHFTRAAESAGISQSGLSSAIRNLEDELGTALFDRTTRRVELTDAGAALLPYAREMLARASAARDAVVKAGHDVTGSMTIGAEQCLGIVDVAALLERFHRRQPRVQTSFVQTGSQELVAMMRRGELDVAFVASDRGLGPFPHRPLGQQSLVLIAPAGHPLAARAAVSWNDLEGCDFVDFADPWGMRMLNDTLLAAHGVTRRIRCTVTDVHMLLDLVVRGLGIAVVPAHVAAKPEAVALRRVELPEEARHAWKVSVVSPSWDRGGAPATHLLDLVTDAHPLG
jgi:DNA-binding transcriptional LysR family regulator